MSPLDPLEILQVIGYTIGAFIHVLLETADARDAVHVASTASLARIRDFLGGLARDAGAPDPDDLARKWHILMKGSIISAGEGDAEAARRAQAIGRLVLDAELPAGA